MKEDIILLTVYLAAAAASPLVVRQDINFQLVDDTPNPPTASIAIGVASQLISYDLAAATAAATANPLPVKAVPAGLLERTPNLAARTACEPQPTGAGPIPSPDTADAFLAYDAFSSAAVEAATPPDYSKTFTNLQGSSNAYGYMGLTTLDTYDPAQCAAYCDNIDGCFGINIYFERSPSVEPGEGCEDPASTTVIKCTFWGGYLEAANAVNHGQWRDQFHVVIAGSNSYMSTAIPQVAGYEAEALGNTAINAPLDCNGQDTYMGVKIFTTTRFDPGLCAAACESQNEYNLAHPPATGQPALCRFFTTYLMAKNGSPEGQYCNLYTATWNSSYATNEGQWRGSDHYTVGYAFSYSNIESPGYPVCEGEV